MVDRRELQQARRDYKALSNDARHRLAREQCVVRGEELRRAYPNVVRLLAGYRLRQGKKRQRVVREVCVVFVVGKKWSDGKKRSNETIPTEVLAYADVDGRRSLVAIPTDVIAESEFTDLGPNREIVEVNEVSTGRNDSGTVAVPLDRAGDNALYALSCRHVFSLSLIPGSVASNLSVATRGGDEVGRTTSTRGMLRDKQHGRSFDAQIARLNSEDALDQLFGGFSLDGPQSYARSWSEIPETYFVMVPRRINDSVHARAQARAIKVQRVHELFDFDVPYGNGIGQVQHKVLYRGNVQSSSDGIFPGDSGAPAFSRADGGVFLGMHIIGHHTRGDVSIMLPAWLLMSPHNYGQSGSPMWRLHTPGVDAANLEDSSVRSASEAAVAGDSAFERRIRFTGLRDAARKANRFRERVIAPVCAALDAGGTAAEELLLGTAIQESGLKHRTQIGGGPALGLFQMERATHNDIWDNFLRFKPGLSARVSATLSSASANRLDELRDNDAYAAAMARVHYLRVSDPLPAAGQLRAQAQYWKKFYNTHLGAGTVTKYINSWKAVFG